MCHVFMNFSEFTVLKIGSQPLASNEIILVQFLCGKSADFEIALY